MTFLTNFKAILFEKRGFSVKLAPKKHPVCPLRQGFKAEK